MRREDQWRVSVTVAGKPLGVFDKLSGGNVDSEESKYRPGGMAPEISLGGKKTVENVTVTRNYGSDDHVDYPWLVDQVGKAQVDVAMQPLDADRNPWGSPIVYSGTLKSVQRPDHDSSGDDAGMLELEVSTVAVV